MIPFESSKQDERVARLGDQAARIAQLTADLEQARADVARMERANADARQWIKDLKNERDAARRDIGRFKTIHAHMVEKVKRLQGELVHSEYCTADKSGALDGSACATCLVLEDFGLTEEDLVFSATTPTADARAQRARDDALEEAAQAVERIGPRVSGDAIRALATHRTATGGQAE